MTSNGFVTMAAQAPAAPAQMKYQKMGISLVQGLIQVFMFSLTQTTVVINGMFIRTVTG